MRHIAIVGSALILMFGCGATPGTQPDDMSAAEHRAHAAAEKREAAKHTSQYDGDATDVAQYGAEVWDVVIYNPTQVHLERASEHRTHAADHLAAASALEAFEEAECKSFPAVTRKECPLLGTVEEVQEVEGGVSITLSDKLDREAALAHVKCHLAYARTRGRKGMSHCPLYVEGVSASAGQGAHVIELRVEHSERLSALRERARSHIGR